MAAEQAWGEQFGKILMRRVTQATGWDEPREESGRAAWLALEELQKRLEGHAYSEVSIRRGDCRRARRSPVGGRVVL